MASIYWRGPNNDTAILNWGGRNNRQRVSLGKISPEAAEIIRLEKELEERTGQTTGQTTGQVFETFSKSYLKSRKATYPDSHPRIEQIFRDYLVPFFGDKRLIDIDLPIVEEYRNSRQAKSETIKKELRSLNALLNKAVEWKVIPANPIPKMPSFASLDSKPPRWYTVEELEAIYAAAPYNWFIWRFLANTGLRRKELLNLRYENIVDDTIQVLSTSTNRTKSGFWRPVPLSDGAKYALSMFKTIKGPLVTTTGPSLSRAFSRVLQRSGIVEPYGSIHSLRHTFCSHLVMSGVDLTTVQRLAGHSKTEVTEKYAHLAPGHLADSVQLLKF